MNVKNIKNILQIFFCVFEDAVFKPFEHTMTFFLKMFLIFLKQL